MPEEEAESAIEALTRNVSLPLRVVGGRVFMQNADADNIDRCTIELKCWWSPGFAASFDNSIRVGDDKHKPSTKTKDGESVSDENADEEVGWDLLNCPIMLSVYRVDDKWLAESAAKNGGKPILGDFSYHAPVQTRDGVVNEQRPTINAWIGLGRDNFELLRNRLVETETPDLDLGISVEFPPGTVERGWVSTEVNWDGKDSLPVSAATIVWKRSDWDNDTEPETDMDQDPEPESDNSAQEQAELLRALNRLESTVGKLAIPIWIVVGAVIILAFVGR